MSFAKQHQKSHAGSCLAWADVMRCSRAWRAWRRAEWMRRLPRWPRLRSERSEQIRIRAVSSVSVEDGVAPGNAREEEEEVKAEDNLARKPKTLLRSHNRWMLCLQEWTSSWPWLLSFDNIKMCCCHVRCPFKVSIATSDDDFREKRPCIAPWY